MLSTGRLLTRQFASWQRKGDWRIEQLTQNLATCKEQRTLRFYPRALLVRSSLVRFVHLRYVYTVHQQLCTVSQVHGCACNLRSRAAYKLPITNVPSWNWATSLIHSRPIETPFQTQFLHLYVRLDEQVRILRALSFPPSPSGGCTVGVNARRSLLNILFLFIIYLFSLFLGVWRRHYQRLAHDKTCGTFECERRGAAAVN